MSVETTAGRDRTAQLFGPVSASAAGMPADSAVASQTAAAAGGRTESGTAPRPSRSPRAGRWPRRWPPRRRPPTTRLSGTLRSGPDPSPVGWCARARHSPARRRPARRPQLRTGSPCGRRCRPPVRRPRCRPPRPSQRRRRPPARPPGRLPPQPSRPVRRPPTRPERNGVRRRRSSRSAGLRCAQARHGRQAVGGARRGGRSPSWCSGVGTDEPTVARCRPAPGR